MGVSPHASKELAAFGEAVAVVVDEGEEVFGQPVIGGQGFEHCGGLGAEGEDAGRVEGGVVWLLVGEVGDPTG